MNIQGISHITYIVQNLDRAALFFCQGLGATEVYDSKARKHSLSREKFFVLGGIWIAAMEGQAPTERSYQHLALAVSAEDLPKFELRLRATGVEITPARPRIAGEGLSLYFHDFDNHLFELHTGSLEERLSAYRRQAV